MACLITKNWAEFQHYKDRSPPWIKLHKELLDDRHYQSLPLASRALAPMLWLLASETKDGSFDADPEELAFRLRTNIKDITTGLKPLIDKGFFIVVQDASSVLADCVHVAVPETETETETETEPAALAFVLPDWIPGEVWGAFLEIRKTKKAKNTPYALGLLVKTLEQIKAAGHDPITAINASIKGGWSDVYAPKTQGFAKPDPTATVPSKPGRDPELAKREADERNRAAPSLQTLEAIAKIRQGVAA